MLGFTKSRQRGARASHVRHTGAIGARHGRSFAEGRGFATRGAWARHVRTRRAGRRRYFLADRLAGAGGPEFRLASTVSTRLTG